MFKKIAVVVVRLVPVLVVVSSVVWLPAMARPIAEQRLREAFAGAEVSVGKLSLAMPLSVVLSGIEVRSKACDIRIAKASLDRHGRVMIFSPRVELRDIPTAWFESRPGAKPLPFKSIRLDDLNLNMNLQSSGVEARIRGSALYDLKTGISTGRLVADSFRWKSLSARDVVVEAAGPEGAFQASEVRAGKLKATRVSGAIRTAFREIHINGLTADVAGGRGEGEARIRFENGLNYQATLLVQSVNMVDLTRDLELERKMTATGTLDGKIALSGDQRGLLGLSGSLISGAGGGDLVIRDPELIERLAQNIRQPVELVDAAFKEYHFDSGAMTLGLEDGDIVLGANLEGAKGKRDLVVHLHQQP